MGSKIWALIMYARQHEGLVLNRKSASCRALCLGFFFQLQTFEIRPSYRIIYHIGIIIY